MPLSYQQQFNRFQNQEAADGGSGGGGEKTAITPEIQAIIDSKVNDAITGLKAKNGDLIGAQKRLKEQLDQFEGIDPNAVRNMMKQFADSEEAGLLAAGKMDEVVSKRVDRMRSDYDKQIKARDDALAQAHAKAAKLAAGKVSGVITTAASKSGGLPEGMEDIVLRSQAQGWTVNDDGDVVAMRGGEIVLGKDGKTPLSPIEWAESLREVAPHLFNKPQGTGAIGASGGGSKIAKSKSEMTTKEKSEYISKHGREAYFALS
jgi:hypothetical protein